MTFTDIQLAKLQAETLFVQDERGHLLRINEPDPEGPAPRFFLSQTQAGNLWRTRYDLPATIANALERLAAEEPINGNLHDKPRYLADYVKLLEQHTTISEESSGPAYYLPSLPIPDSALLITQGNAGLLQANYPYTMNNLGLHEPVIAVIADGVAVALCRSVRLTPHAAEAGVDTEHDYRGRGYAAITTQAWAAYVRATNRLPLYSTSWDNIASQSVARKLGAVQYAATVSLY